MIVGEIGIVADAPSPVPLRVSAIVKAVGESPVSAANPAHVIPAKPTTRVRLNRSPSHASGSVARTSTTPPRLAMPVNTVSEMLSVFWMSGPSTCTATWSADSNTRSSVSSTIIIVPPSRNASRKPIASPDSPGRRSTATTTTAASSATTAGGATTTVKNFASDTGVTDTTIKIAIHSADLSGLIKAGAIKGVPEDAGPQNALRISYYLDKWNAEGGI